MSYAHSTKAQKLGLQQGKTGAEWFCLSLAFFRTDIYGKIYVCKKLEKNLPQKIIINASTLCNKGLSHQILCLIADDWKWVVVVEQNLIFDGWLFWLSTNSWFLLKQKNANIRILHHDRGDQYNVVDTHSILLAILSHNNKICPFLIGGRWGFVLF